MLVCWSFMLEAMRRDTFRFAFYRGVSGSIMRMNWRDRNLQWETWFADGYIEIFRRKNRGPN